jgi:hypothetical protein
MHNHPPDWNLVEEIAQRVWFTEAVQPDQCLFGFDPTRGDLIHFLALRANRQIQLFYRERRKVPEVSLGHREPPDIHGDGDSVPAALIDFAATLSPGQAHELEELLASLPDCQHPALSVKTWKAHQCLRDNLHQFYQED